MHRIDALLKSEIATLAVLVAALAAQMPHAARLFASLASGDGAIHSWLYAVALETAVLVFVVRGRRNVSYMFAAVSVAVNLSYYAIAGGRVVESASVPGLAGFNLATGGHHALLARHGSPQHTARHSARKRRTRCHSRKAAENTASARTAPHSGR